MTWASGRDSNNAVKRANPNRSFPQNKQKNIKREDFLQLLFQIAYQLF